MATSTTSRFNGIVLHLMFKGETSEEFRNFCVQKFSQSGCVATCFEGNALIGAFDKGGSEMVACNLAHDIREYLDEQRNKKESDVVLKASINGGEVIIGNTINDSENEILGTAINISFQLLDNTSPMQISLTRRVFEKVNTAYSAIARRPVALGNKTVSLFYLNTKN